MPSYTSVFRESFHQEYQERSRLGDKKVSDISIPWFFDGRRTDLLMRELYREFIESGSGSIVSEVSTLDDYIGYNPLGSSYLNMISYGNEQYLIQVKKFDRWKKEALQEYK